MNCNPERGTSFFSSSTSKDRSHKCTRSVIKTATEFPGFSDPFLINTASLLLLYNGKIINSWTLAKADIGLHYLWSLSLIIYPTYSIVSFPCNKQALPFQIAPSTLHQGTRKLSTKHDSVPTCLAHLVPIKPERPKVATQRLWLRAKYVLSQIGHRVHFFLSESFFLCLCCGIFHRVIQHWLKYLILNAIALLFALLSCLRVQCVKGKYFLNAENMAPKRRREGAWLNLSTYQIDCRYLTLSTPSQTPGYGWDIYLELVYWRDSLYEPFEPWCTLWGMGRESSLSVKA